MSKTTSPFASVSPSAGVGVALPPVMAALKCQSVPEVWSPVVARLPSASRTLWTLIVPPQVWVANSARAAARVLKLVVITSDVSTLPVFTLGPEMAIMLAVSRSFPTPMARIRMPAVLIVSATRTALATATVSLTLVPVGPVRFGLPSEAKITRSGLSARSAENVP